jgi:hypothetical protein
METPMSKSNAASLELEAYEQQLEARAASLVPVTDAIDEQEGYFDRSKSVVKKSYKTEYKARGDVRGNSDWLFTTLKALTLGDDGKLDLATLEAIVEANGIPAKYENRSPGWQGRMRMTLGLRLRPVVAKAGFLRLDDGQTLEAPATFVTAWKK